MIRRINCRLIVLCDALRVFNMYLVTYAQPKAMNCSKYFLRNQIHSHQIHHQNPVVNVGFYDVTPVALIHGSSRVLARGGTYKTGGEIDSK